MGNKSSTECKMFKNFENGKINIDTYNDCVCTICLMPLVKEKDCKTNCNVCVSTSLWTCNHKFHNSCINYWIKENNSCPVCRCTNMLSNDEEIYSDTEDDIENNDNIYTIEINDKMYIMKVDDIYVNMPVTLEKYTSLWNYELCDNQYNNHTVIFIKGYGIIGMCSCGSTQTFNYVG